jgi:lysophospholipase L1-like esterase
MSGPALERAAADPPTSSFRWIACGDSFTAGLEPGESWTDIVAAELGPGRDAELTNVAVVGATAAMVKAGQLPRAIAAGPDLVTLICGGNDVIGAVRPRPAELATELGRAFARLAAELPDARLLTATYPPIAADALRPRTRRRISHGMDALNELIRETADRTGFTCVELHDHPGRSDRSNYAADGIHPSPAGQRAAAAVLGPVIETLMNGNSDPTDTTEEEQ